MAPPQIATAFMRAAKVISDSGLAPGETRREDFDLPLPQGVAAHVNAKLWYTYAPLAQGKPQNRFVFLTLNRIVK